MCNKKIDIIPFQPLASSKEMSRLDMVTMKNNDIDSLQLMWNAANALYAEISQYVSDSVLILCGAGNNGGDGYALASILSNKYIKVFIINVAEKIKSNDTLYYRNLALNKANVYEVSKEEIVDQINCSSIIIDAVYGTGFHGIIPSEIAGVFKIVNESSALRISVDIPSGAVCDTAELAVNAFNADITITFEILKPALVSYPSKDNCGEVKIVKIGFQKSVIRDINTSAFLISNDIASFAHSFRMKNSNKGDFGKILSICGSKGMVGAAYLSAMAALRSGIGLLYIACEEQTLLALQIKLTEPVFIVYDNIDEIGLLDKYDAVMHGCGCGTLSADITEFIIKNTKSILVLDADALNNIAKNQISIQNNHCTLIITPHPGEMSRLVGCSIAEIQSNRIYYATEYAKKHNCYVVLKGAATIIADPNGRYAVNCTGNSGLSKGGSGDVLAGMITAYCSKSENIFESICAAVYEHGAAADRLLQKHTEINMLPTDLLSEINAI